jgi:hypothetical protein
MMIEEGAWSEELQCRWLRWEVVDEHTLKLFLPEKNYCDMGGCIKIGQSLMPHVKLIITYAGIHVDTEYSCLENDKWAAIPAQTLTK